MIVTLNFSLLCHDICFQSFFSPFLRQISIQPMWVARLMQFAGKCFFKRQSYRPKELINKLLTKWNRLRAFLIHFTLYLYLWWNLCLWWRVSRFIYIFPKVSSLDEKSLGKIVLMLCLWKCKKASIFEILIFETYVSVCCVCYMYIFILSFFDIRYNKIPFH